MNINKEALVAQFPRSGGKIPALEGKDFKLTEVMAIAMVRRRAPMIPGGLSSPSRDADGELLVASFHSTWQSRMRAAVTGSWATAPRDRKPRCSPG